MGAGLTRYLLSLASSHYFRLGSTSTHLAKCLLEAWARATCGVVEWFRLCHSLAEGHSVRHVTLLFQASVSLLVQWGWHCAECLAST